MEKNTIYCVRAIVIVFDVCFTLDTNINAANCVTARPHEKIQFYYLFIKFVVMCPCGCYNINCGILHIKGEN